MRIHAALIALLALTIAPHASADTVPGSSLQLEIVSRQWMTFTIDVTNRSDNPSAFDSTGLYFVPDSTSDSPPQRLGVATPPELAGTQVEVASPVTLPPHSTLHLVVPAYCLDQHRAGPQANTTYHVAGMRMPAVLSSAIASAVQNVHAPRGTDAHDAIQSAVWSVRETTPVVLIGQ